MVKLISTPCFHRHWTSALSWQCTSPGSKSKTIWALSDTSSAHGPKHWNLALAKFSCKRIYTVHPVTI